MVDITRPKWPEAYAWPYAIKYGTESQIAADVLVIGGGIAGCWAAISAARRGLRVVLVDKAHVRRSGAGGSGCDHWQFAATNPACRLTPEELTQALIDNHGGQDTSQPEAAAGGW